MLEIFISAFGPAVALGINSGVLRAGRDPEEDEIEPLSRVLLERARATPSIAYLGAVAQLQALARGIVAFFADYDLLVTPALVERPLAIGACDGCGDDPLHDLSRSGHFTPYTSLFNVTGQPAISLPVGFGADGLPTGVQIVGKPLNEDTLRRSPPRGEGAPVGAPPAVTVSTSAMRRGCTPSASASAVPRALSISTASNWASSQVRSEVGPASASSARSAVRRPASGSGSAAGGARRRRARAARPRAG